MVRVIIGPQDPRHREGVGGPARNGTEVSPHRNGIEVSRGLLSLNRPSRDSREREILNPDDGRNVQRVRVRDQRKRQSHRTHGDRGNRDRIGVRNQRESEILSSNPSGIGPAQRGLHQDDPGIIPAHRPVGIPAKLDNGVIPVRLRGGGIAVGEREGLSVLRRREPVPARVDPTVIVRQRGTRPPRPIEVGDEAVIPARRLGSEDRPARGLDPEPDGLRIVCEGPARRYRVAERGGVHRGEVPRHVLQRELVGLTGSRTLTRTDSGIPVRLGRGQVVRAIPVIVKVLPGGRGGDYARPESPGSTRTGPGER